MEIKFKKMDERAVAPYKKHLTDAGVDLTAISVEYDKETDSIVYDTGIAVEIPAGYVGLIFPRSSIAAKDLLLSNSVGVIDADYRASIKTKFKVNATYYDASVDFDSFQSILEDGIFLCYDFKSHIEEELYTQYKTYAVGDRICQLVIVPIIMANYTESDTLSDTERGKGGFGSTGK